MYEVTNQNVIKPINVTRFMIWVTFYVTCFMIWVVPSTAVL